LSSGDPSRACSAPGPSASEVYTLSLRDALPISAAPRSPATVVKRANISVCLPTLEKIAARVYFVMSWVTVKVPKAPEPLACMRRSEEHTSELQSREKLVCRLLLEKKKETALEVE